ncbi:MAG TPA: calcium-binding protein [Allosphingosinicella sp.]|nr:calcium-binding protein [Allosphingosinicella sp.]
MTGNHFVPSDHNDETIFDFDGEVAGTSSDNVGFDPAIAELSNGNLVIAADGSDDIFYTILDASGGTIVASTGLGEAGDDVLECDVAGGLTGGRFVIAYQDSFGGSDNDIGLSIRNNDGTFVTGFAVDSSEANDQRPSVGALASGNFAVAWHRSVEGGATQLWYAVYDAGGGIVKEPTLLDSVGTINRNPSVVALADGGFAIAYEDNGWSQGNDIDISYARFAATGTNIDIDDVSRNAHNDTLPSTTLLSNGLVVLGSTSDATGDLNPAWNLVGANTGHRLAEAAWGGTSSMDTQTAVAGMSFGRIAAFFSNIGAGDVVGQMLEVWRKSTGDSGDNAFIGDTLFDWVIAGGGNDVIAGGRGRDFVEGQGGDDTFQFGTGDIGAGEYVDGGAGLDRIVALSSISFLGATVHEIDEIEYHEGTLDPISVTLRWDQAPFRIIVDGRDGPAADMLRIVIGSGSLADLSSYEFVGFDPGPTTDDRIVIIGDDDAERIVGSQLSDEIIGKGGDDRLNGFSGVDVLRGGAGGDVYIVDEAGEAREGANQGVDIVCSSVDYELGSNLERLRLLGAKDLRATGNDLPNGLTGNGGDNTLVGLGGNDLLAGGDGVDRFVINTVLNAATNVDRITDFVASDDIIMLDRSLFTAIGPGTLDGDEFRAAAAAGDASDRIIYDRASGRIFYDPDGTGGATQTLFARVDAGTPLDQTDFFAFGALGPTARGGALPAADTLMSLLNPAAHLPPVCDEIAIA